MMKAFTPGIAPSQERLPWNLLRAEAGTLFLLVSVNTSTLVLQEYFLPAAVKHLMIKSVTEMEMQ